MSMISGIAHHHSWFAHQVGSSLIHGVVYGVIYKVFRELSLPMVLLLAGAILAAVWWWSRRE